MSERVKGAEMARRLGVTAQTFYEGARRGRATKGADGLYDVADTLERWPRTAGGGNNPSGVGRGESKVDIDAEKTRVYTEGLRLKNERLADRLVDRDAAEHRVASLVIEFRDSLLAWCQTTAPIAASESQGDAGAIRRCLDREARLLLARMAERAGSFELAGSDPAEDAGDDREGMEE